MMTEQEQLRSLIAQLETGPGRNIDLGIELALEAGGYDYPADNWAKDAPLYTTSIDAALALTDGWANIAKRHLLHRVMRRIDQNNLDAATDMARLICAEALPQIIRPKKQVRR
jgi:hypothetical protein